MATKTRERPAAATTAAASLFNSPAVESALQAILRELAAAQSRLTGVRAPSRELVESYQQHLARIEAVRGRPPLYPYIGSGLGHGPLVELLDGSVKYDMINGIGVHMFGHGDPDMIATAIRAAMSDIVMQGNLQFNADSTEFAETLVAEAAQGSSLRFAFITNSGAMANEQALKVCYQKTNAAPRIIAFNDCFMGRSTTMAQIGDTPGYRVGIPLSIPVDYMPFYDPDLGRESIDLAVRRLRQYINRYPSQHACFVFELVQGEGGFNTAPREFFIPLMELCRESGIPVWIDEVQTFGRTGRMFHFQQLELGQHVDIVTIGKMSLACAVLFAEAISPKPGLLSGTFIGSSVGLQVGKRVIERLRDGGYYGSGGRIARLHEAFGVHAKALVEKHPDWFPPVPDGRGGRRVRGAHYGGIGGMMRFTPFAGEKPRVMKALNIMFEEGVIAFYCGHDPYHIRFLPPIGVMEPAQFADVFTIVERALGRAAKDGD
jgi:4-aminobutyrate aminotransferase-like enzyme